MKKGQHLFNRNNDGSTDEIVSQLSFSPSCSSSFSPRRTHCTLMMMPRLMQICSTHIRTSLSLSSCLGGWKIAGKSASWCVTFRDARGSKSQRIRVYTAKFESRPLDMSSARGFVVAPQMRVILFHRVLEFSREWH